MAAHQRKCEGESHEHDASEPPDPATAVAALATLALTASPALADGGSGHSILRAPLVGSMRADAPIAGIQPGGVSWVNGPSTARVREDGRIRVEIEGLVIPPPDGTNVNPITSVVAMLVCDGMAVSSTDEFALNAAGDGSTRDVITGTRDCDDPVVLIQPAANLARFIASTVDDHHDD